jgi:hypothetical protein
MNISDFPGFPGFLGMATSHPDKQRVQKETKIEDDTLTMEEEIDKVIDSFTNPFLFKQNEDGSFEKDLDGNLIRNFEIK